MRLFRREDPVLKLLDELIILGRSFDEESQARRQALLALAEILATDSIEDAHDHARRVLAGMTICGRPGDEPETYLPLLRAIVGRIEEIRES